MSDHRHACNGASFYANFTILLRGNTSREVDSNTMDIKSLEAKVDALIEALDELERKNSMLESDRENWLVERNRLLEKNELAKNKVEAMILRLKALEQN